jgi:hypothetical protein
MSSVTEPLSPSIRGISYPLKVSDGNLATNVDYALVTQQIRSVVETRYYERVMRAEYGIGDYVLEILDPGQINSAIQYSILQNVDGLTDLSVLGEWKTNGEDGLYNVFIEYAINGVPQPALNFSLAN